MISSLTAEQIISTAKECYELGLIDKTRLELVTRKAETEVGYNAILDLPLSHEIENERELRRKAARIEQRASVRRRFLRAIGVR